MKTSDGKQVQVRNPESKKGKERIAKFQKTDIQEQLMCAMSVQEWAKVLLEIVHSDKSSPRNKLDALTLFARYTFPTPTTQNLTINADVNRELGEWVKGGVVEFEDTDKEVIDIE